GISGNSKIRVTDEYFQNFCREIINRHYFIRSAAIADYVGQLMATSYRRRLIPLMTQEDSSRAAAQAAIRAATRNKFKSKIGDLEFSLSRYDKLVRATIPIKNGEKIKFLLLLTFDIEAEAESIILNRILPYVAENKDYFIQ
ncbi:MAG: hypothetical protein WA220_04125, partial [Candidatus Nitrosopolaris sp.]